MIEKLILLNETEFKQGNDYDIYGDAVQSISMGQDDFGNTSFTVRFENRWIEVPYHFVAYYCGSR